MSKAPEKQKPLSKFQIMRKALIVGWACLGLMLTAGPLRAQVQEDAGNTPHAKLSGEAFAFNLFASGSQYLFEEWVRGEVSLATGAVVKAESLRYNGYLDELIWLNPLGSMPVMVDKSLVSSFVLYGPHDRQPLVFEKISHRSWYASEPSQIYAQVLYRGEMSLMAYRNIRKTGENTIYTESGITVKENISPSHEYFLLSPEGRVHQIRQFNRRTFRRLFPDHRTEIRQALRGISIHTDAQRVVFISRLDALMYGRENGGQ